MPLYLVLVCVVFDLKGNICVVVGDEVRPSLFQSVACADGKHFVVSIARDNPVQEYFSSEFLPRSWFRSFHLVASILRS